VHCFNKNLFKNNIQQRKCCQSIKHGWKTTDGEAYRKSDFFQDPKAIRLLLYTDAFEVANPLRSGRKKHKIHAIYYILGNLLTHNRSNIDQIQLIMLCRDVDLLRFQLRKYMVL